MNAKARLRILEREQDYRVWIAAGEFFKGRSFAELMFFSIFGWFLSDDPNASLENRKREFEFAHYRMVVELHENVAEPLTTLLKQVTTEQAALLLFPAGDASSCLSSEWGATSAKLCRNPALHAGNSVDRENRRPSRF